MYNIFYKKDVLFRYFIFLEEEMFKNDLPSWGKNVCVVYFASVGWGKNWVSFYETSPKNCF